MWGFSMDINEILVASTNKNKICQIESKLSLLGIKVLSMSDFNVEDPVESGKNYVENAIIKAENAFLRTGIPSVADDSGFELEYINGFPGLVSARFAHSCGGYKRAFEILNGCLNENKKACFKTSIALVYKEKDKIIKKTFDGTLTGEFVFPPRGENGFGYCPCFKPNGYEQTMAEISNDLRENINHRSIALDKLYKFLKTEN